MHKNVVFSGGDVALTLVDLIQTIDRIKLLPYKHVRRYIHINEVTIAELVAYVTGLNSPSDMSIDSTTDDT
jgi:hypothetical protein